MANIKRIIDEEVKNQLNILEEQKRREIERQNGILAKENRKQHIYRLTLETAKKFAAEMNLIFQRDKLDKSSEQCYQLYEKRRLVFSIKGDLIATIRFNVRYIEGGFGAPEPKQLDYIVVVAGKGYRKLEDIPEDKQFTESLMESLAKAYAVWKAKRISK